MAKNRQGSSSSFYGAGLTTTASITLVLLLLGLTILIAFLGQRTTSYIKENMTVSIEIRDNMKDAEILKIQKQLQKSPFVKDIVYISKEEIKKQLIHDLGRDPEEVLGFNPASSCFDINLKAEYANSDSMAIITKALKGQNVFQNIVYNEDDLNMVNSNLSKIGTILFGLALILILISFTLIRNTIRLNIYSKRFTINTMQLVGATDGFIMKPFIKQTVSCGIIAAFLANMLITVIVYAITTEYTELLSIIRKTDLIIIYFIVLILGILLTFVATTLSVNKYLKMHTNNLYHI